MFIKDNEVEMAVREWLLLADTDFYRERMIKVVPILDKCINVRGIYFEK
jgi:hypothetical protein